MIYQVLKILGGNLNAYYQVKETNLKGFILYTSNYLIFRKRQNYEDNRRMGGCQRLEGEERLIGRAQDF